MWCYSGTKECFFLYLTLRKLEKKTFFCTKIALSNGIYILLQKFPQWIVRRITLLPPLHPKIWGFILKKWLPINDSKNCPSLSTTICSRLGALIQVTFWTPTGTQTSLTAAQSSRTSNEGGMNSPPVTVLTWLWEICSRYLLQKSPRLISGLRTLIQVPLWSPTASHTSLTDAQSCVTWKGGGMNIPPLTVLTWLFEINSRYSTWGES